MRPPKLSTLVLIACSSFLAGCGAHDRATHHGFKSANLDPFAGNGSPYYKGRGPIPFGGGRYQVGNAYQVAGRWFKPHEQPGYDKTGVASWYGEAFHRRKTSNGEWFDMNTLTAAHATLPLPSYVKVTNLENNRQVIVRVNDRGPFVNTRVIDVSKRAADALGYRINGTAHVRVQLLGPAPLNDHGQHLMALNSALSNGASMNQLVALVENPAARDSTVQVAEASPMPAKSWKARAKPEPQAIETAAYQPEAAPAPAGFMVRVAVFHSIENANAAYAQMSSLGPTQIVQAVGANGPLYRVQIGPLDNSSDAQSALSSAIASGFEDAKIIEMQITQVSSN